MSDDDAAILLEVWQCNRIVTEGGRVSKGLSTRELARQLGVSPSTLRIWEDVLQLQIPRDEQNHRRYPPELIETLVEIARLRQSGYDYARIARDLRLSIHEPADESAIEDEGLLPNDLLDVPPPAPVAAVIAEPVATGELERPVSEPAAAITETTSYTPEPAVMPTSVLGKDSFDLLQAYTRLSDDHRALSAKYAEATFAIGQLEERVQYLTQQLLESESRTAKLELAKLEAAEVKALPAPAEALKVDDTAIRDLEGQVRLLALAVLNTKPMTVWERFTLWWNR
jgi:DNA-binding transcriptional MerR regulator